MTPVSDGLADASAAVPGITTRPDLVAKAPVKTYAWPVAGPKIKGTIRNILFNPSPARLRFTPVAMVFIDGQQQYLIVPSAHGFQAKGRCPRSARPPQ